MTLHLGSSHTLDGGQAVVHTAAERISAFSWSTDSNLFITSSYRSISGAAGPQPDCVVGMTLREYFPDATSDSPIVDAHRRALQGESVSLKHEGFGHSFQVSVSALRDKQGRIVGCTGIARDAAQQYAQQRSHDSVELERRLRQRTAELAAANESLREEIIDRQRAEKSLLKKNQLINGILRNMPVTAFLLDKDGFFLESVGAGLARLGRKDHELVGKNALNVFPESCPWIQRALAGQCVHFESQGQLDGELWAFDNFLAFDALRGSGAVGFAIDVSERKRVEQREETLRAELAHIARVQTMGEMASGMAHELNQPLAAIVMQAEVAAHRTRAGKLRDPGELLELFQHVADQAYRAGQIVRRMKQFVKKAGPHRSTTEVAELVDEVLPLVESDLRHAGISLTRDVERSTPSVLADKIQIQQVLLNLIRNAIEAMESGSPDPRKLSILARPAQGQVEITVRDTGCGTPEDHLDRLFGTFYSTKPNGMGMGLAISRSIVEAHGGRIWANRNPDRGTAFTFTLPIAGTRE